MSRNQIVFFLIIAAALAIVGFGIVAQGLGGDANGDNGNGTQSAEQPTSVRPALTLQVAVTPLVEDWLREAASSYNRSNPTVDGRPVQIELVSQESLAIW